MPWKILDRLMGNRPLVLLNTAIFYFLLTEQTPHQFENLFVISSCLQFADM